MAENSFIYTILIELLHEVIEVIPIYPKQTSNELPRCHK